MEQDILKRMSGNTGTSSPLPNYVICHHPLCEGLVIGDEYYGIRDPFNFFLSGMCETDHQHTGIDYFQVNDMHSNQQNALVDNMVETNFNIINKDDAPIIEVQKVLFLSSS